MHSTYDCERHHYDKCCILCILKKLHTHVGIGNRFLGNLECIYIESYDSKAHNLRIDRRVAHIHHLVILKKHEV